MESMTSKALRKVRLQNILDNAVSKGFASLIFVLTVVAVVIVAVAGLFYLVLCWDSGMGPAEALWTAFSFLTNPELPSYEDASGTIAYAVITLIIVIAGLLVTSALIGIITTALETYYEGLQRGFSTVMEEGHIAVIGFNDNARTLITEFLEAHKVDRTFSMVFIDDKLSREEMERRIEGFAGMSLHKLQSDEGMRIVCRNGNLRDPDNLKRYAVDKAKAIIINDFDDAVILKTLLAVTSLLRRNSDNVHTPTIVCTFRDAQFARAARHVGYEKNLRILSLSSTLSNLIAKTCYQPGLSKVLDEVYSYEGSELYFVKGHDYAGRSFDELVNMFEQSIPVGICRANDSLACGADILINVPDSSRREDYDELMTVRAEDEIVVLAPDAATAHMPIRVSHEKYACECDIARLLDEPTVFMDDHKSILVVGYDETFDRTIVNLAQYYASVASEDEVNCAIKLLYRNKREKRVGAARRRFLDEFGEIRVGAAELETAHGYDSELKPCKDILIETTRVSFQCALSDVIDLPVLERVFLQGEHFDHVIVLSDLAMDREAADTETLLTLLYLRAIAENARAGKYDDEGFAEGRVRPFSITSEIQNMENVDLAYNEYVSDYIISWKLIASLQAQVAENRHLYKVLRNLLTPRGSQIQLERVSCYVDEQTLSAGAPVDFDELSVRLRQMPNPAQKRVVLGYVNTAEGRHVLCPQRDGDGRRMVNLAPNDMLVVIRSN